MWDSEKKRWVNLEAEQDDAANELKPPPKMSDMYPKQQPLQPPLNVNSGSMSLPPTLPSHPHEAPMENKENIDGSLKALQPNMFKLQRRGRSN